MIALAEVAGGHHGEDDEEGEQEGPEEGRAWARDGSAEQTDADGGGDRFGDEDDGFEEGGRGEVKKVCQAVDWQEEPHNEWRVRFEDLGAVEADTVEHAIGDVETPKLVVTDGRQKGEKDGHAGRCGT